MRVLLSALLIVFLSELVSAQETAIVYGVIKSDLGIPLEYVNVVNMNTQQGVVTDASGYYEISVEADKSVTLGYSHIGFGLEERQLFLARGMRFKLDMSMERTDFQLIDVPIEDQRIRNEISTQKIDAKTIELFPSTIGGVEGILKTLPGVSSNNELSSQYSVRGGNYDENLVYVNDFEIYRPFLIRSGQQEGLSFVNPDLVSSILFSSGGFGAKYGDKIASVLDVKYKTPNKPAATFAMSLLGGSAHVEGSSESHRLTYLMGLRYKSNQYLLNTLDVSGEYKPSFTDFQTYISYQLGSDLVLGILGYYSKNKYVMIPEDRDTQFGT
ncbi:MAG: TonB-dependent receptor, partial [Bacteroidetes bacterium]|nr:TonB-dependent receptor [Bacteroidota bacterium]